MAEGKCGPASGEEYKPPWECRGANEEKGSEEEECDEDGGGDNFVGEVGGRAD